MSERCEVVVVGSGAGGGLIAAELGARGRDVVLLEAGGHYTADDFSRFELTEELTGHHHHLVCTSCGAVLDYSPPPRLERSIARVTGELAAATGFRADAHSLDFVGVCAGCDAAEMPDGSARR